jgi:hypothetical protein
MAVALAPPRPTAPRRSPPTARLIRRSDTTRSRLLVTKVRGPFRVRPTGMCARKSFSMAATIRSRTCFSQPLRARLVAVLTFWPGYGLMRRRPTHLPAASADTGCCICEASAPALIRWRAFSSALAPRWSLNTKPGLRISQPGELRYHHHESRHGGLGAAPCRKMRRLALKMRSVASRPSRISPGWGQIT